jgi:ubiquinol-cytochrome c reductase cytochrome b subunit|uniref:Cytochrome b n=1 Tax=Heterosigma akashiwo TaxID=2829 RepID=D2Z248_HETAK|nr:cytochrome b [Heterosigma akashiwo]ACS27116.1 cytochrome b [Heterosigma akashiwo]ACS27155.1 cytochrome b [Heterosigma akashiwo]AOR08487.1 cytochrome b [Heterosigma akashiwo]AOT84783.1 cytochrome b [Heterosigma akashiwo]AOT84825.1 cytochrome b [Heterosigma akashiwo]|mmetsp:Transcript_52049/g.76165  ORF Transcript_52049/g.76165 Transcript_52049/m.76165 type:complete len:387 (-) Transcript_52049:2413-3573(-)
MLRWNKHPLSAFISSHIIEYPTPLNLNYMWSFGSAAGICLVIQIITGIFLAMHYTPHVDYAFASIEHIMRDVNNGWLIRYLHANGASIFFIVVYCHIFRGLYYGSYTKPRGLLWASGVVIFILMMATAFMGYVLPWGQMSFWGVTVITNLFSAIPFVGKSIVEWLWGGFSVDNATLNRFFSLHYLLPFLIAGMTIVHLALLHQNGSNNPLGVEAKTNKIPFYPYFYVKDLLSFFFLLWLFSFFVFFHPNAMGHPDNYIPADSLQTPAHIVPEWYFLPFYAILRAIPHKVGGVVAMGGSLVILFFLPFIHFSKIRSATFRLVYRSVFWVILADFLLLMWLGQKPVDDPYITVGQIVTFFYFFLFLVAIPLSGLIDSYLAKPYLLYKK